MHRLDGGGTGGHGAGRLHTQPRRFVFSGRRAAVREGVLIGDGPGKVVRKSVWSATSPRTRLASFLLCVGVTRSKTDPFSRSQPA